MLERKMEIIKAALEIYIKYGIKSVTMDEMAKQLAVSKKTLYIHVKDKNELVEQCMLYAHSCDLEEIDKIINKKYNAIQESIEIGRYLIETLGAIHPSMFFDLRRYHPKVLNLVLNHKNEALRKKVEVNIERGIEEGVYRDNLNPIILSHIEMNIFDFILAKDVGIDNPFRIDDIYSEYLRYHLHGIASKKGLELLKELIDNDEIF